jgi:hypothetical protein
MWPLEAQKGPAGYSTLKQPGDETLARAAEKPGIITIVKSL